MFSADIDIRPWLRAHPEKAVLKAARQAGGDAQRAMRAEAKRQVRARKRIAAKYLANKSLPLDRPAPLTWRMRVSGAPVPLGEYPRRQTARGVSVEINRGKRVLIKSAFLARMRTGRLGVFLRPTDARYPMGHRLGSSVSDAMQDAAEPTLERARAVFTSAFERLLKHHLTSSTK
jgi:hypothetical protein